LAQEIVFLAQEIVFLAQEIVFLAQDLHQFLCFIKMKDKLKFSEKKESFLIAILSARTKKRSSFIYSLLFCLVLFYHFSISNI
jgi:hypothetical protein